MAIFPQVKFPARMSRFHDLEIIAHHLDEAVIMCYDYHGAHSGPGPVTDVSWAEENIRHALRFMRPERIWLGIPAYGYLWCGGRTEAISAKRGVPLARSHGAVRHPSGTLHATFTRGNATCILDLSDKTTREKLASLARRYGLAGIAIWRLGLED